MGQGSSSSSGARRVYATQVTPGMVLSNGTLVVEVVRHALDRKGMVRVFSDSGPPRLVANDDRVALPADKVRIRFADQEVREWWEDTRVKITASL